MFAKQDQTRMNQTNPTKLKRCVELKYDVNCMLNTTGWGEGNSNVRGTKAKDCHCKSHSKDAKNYIARRSNKCT